MFLSSVLDSHLAKSSRFQHWNMQSLQSNRIVYTMLAKKQRSSTRTAGYPESRFGTPHILVIRYLCLQPHARTSNQPKCQRDGWGRPHRSGNLLVPRLATLVELHNVLDWQYVTSVKQFSSLLLLEKGRDNEYWVVPIGDVATADYFLNIVGLTRVVTLRS